MEFSAHRAAERRARESWLASSDEGERSSYSASERDSYYEEEEEGGDKMDKMLNNEFESVSSSKKSRFEEFENQMIEETDYIFLVSGQAHGNIYVAKDNQTPTQIAKELGINVSEFVKFSRRKPSDTYPVNDECRVARYIKHLI